MRKMASIFLLFAVLLCSCSKPVKEETQGIARLPADTVEQSEETSYEYLEKKELRNGDIISRPYFFKDGTVLGNKVKFEKYGITASVSLLLSDETDPEELMNKQKSTVLSDLKEFHSSITDTITGTGYWMTVISYEKEIDTEQAKKLVTYQYPCETILKLNRLVDGNYLLIKLDVDNEESNNRTKERLSEFLEVYEISVS